jgi:tetratricopeptide (TPR) repeat protein
MASGNFTRALVAFEKARELNPGNAEVERLLAEVQRRLGEASASGSTELADVSVGPLPSSHFQPAGTVSPFELPWQTPLDSLTFFAPDSIATIPDDKMMAIDTNAVIVPAITRLEDDDAALYAQTDFSGGEEAVVDAGWDWRMIIFIGTAAAALLLLPFSGIFQYSSTVRAQAFLLMGNFQRAALVYEKQLRRDPQNVDLYPRLAEIYLRTDRTDAAALQVYENTLRLNLATANRDKLFALITQSQNTRASTFAVQGLSHGDRP